MKGGDQWVQRPPRVGLELLIRLTQEISGVPRENNRPCEQEEKWKIRSPGYESSDQLYNQPPCLL